MGGIRLEDGVDGVVHLLGVVEFVVLLGDGLGEHLLLGLLLFRGRLQAGLGMLSNYKELGWMEGTLVEELDEGFQVVFRVLPLTLVVPDELLDELGGDDADDLDGDGLAEVQLADDLDGFRNER